MAKLDVEFGFLENDILVQRAQKTGSFENYPYHNHETYEMYYLLSGERGYFIKDRSYYIEKGNLILIDRNDIHKSLDHKNNFREGIIIAFNRPFLDAHFDLSSSILEVFKDTKLCQFTASEQSFVEDLLAKMLREFTKKEFGYLEYMKVTLLELLLWLKRRNDKAQKVAPKHVTPMHEKISDIVKYINLNYMENLTLKLISKNFYISPFHLSRVFKDVTGFTFVEYIHSVRTLESQKLLRDSDTSVTDIAQMVGFDSSTHFGRVFKDQTGYSPTKYRALFK
ncbi:AraC family transcriptional regulator [Paenibacillus qinlingensis]|uniref:AraC-like DNA-binding protein n=1 Tax=Paenibacillus qinlingensis TaxID=1837343 RepID=A0ABU1NW89_9BACL|nr:AraC family transcriptional regulator [Paenibacillus qinlingensis]MDR6551727.1 AraC-like DNA-binding protein [Paenibacillus qinlingensis]